MKLPEKKASGTLVPEEWELESVGSAKHEYLAKECADLAVTLVKDTQKILPISPNKYKKIRLYILNDKDDGGFKDDGGAENLFVEKLENEGFDVTVYDSDNLDFHEIFMEGTSEVSHKFDLAIYLANMDTASNQSVRRLDWIHLMAADAPWFVKEIPTMFISISNPYHLEDVPMIQTFINAYTPTETIVDAVIEKIMGRSKFSGVSRMESLEIILERYDRELTENEKDKLANKKNETYRELLNQKNGKNAKFILKRVEVLVTFDAISDGTNITKSKQDSEVFLKAAEYLNEEPENCIVVEDAVAGIDGAKDGDDGSRYW